MPDFDSDLFDYFTLWKYAKQPRREVEWAANLLDEAEAPPEKSGDPIHDYLQAGLERARHTLKGVEREIYVRGKLHQESVAQINYQIGCATHSLGRFRSWAVGYNRGVDASRIELQRTLDDLRKEKRSWRVRFWNDLVRLRAELRERRREYEAALRRAGVHPR